MVHLHPSRATIEVCLCRPGCVCIHVGFAGPHSDSAYPPQGEEVVPELCSASVYTYTLLRMIQVRT